MENNIIINEKETNIFGLRALPQMQNYDNNADWLEFTRWFEPEQEVSDKNFQLVRDVSKNYMTHGVIEIGVSRNGSRSFTNALLMNKPDHVPYFGIDLEDKTYLDNKDKNIYTIKENSFNQNRVRESLKELGIEKISILFIDGWHSLNAVINDWKYADLLSDNGVVFFHDTNYHPGPLVFLDFIDTNKFKIEKHFVGEDDYGMGIAYKI